jgi:hypothetical protein
MISTNLPLTPGIYGIENTLTNRIYIGKTFRLRSRWGLHRSALKSGVHCNILLQCDWHQFGADYFEFRVLEYMDDYDHSRKGKEREYFYMATYFDRLYNISIPDCVPVLASQLFSR